ncbi:MAG: hypothetical protein ACXACR_14350 [Candidatus Hodarchaeales archaeon]|jgi:hypothetical protein
MKFDNVMLRPPFDKFPYHHALSIIDKLEYLGEESSPYEVAPGTDLCTSDTYYTLGFLVYLHAFGKVVSQDDKWFLDPKGEPLSEKPYRFTLIADAVKILKVLMKGPQVTSEIDLLFPKLSEQTVNDYFYVLSLLAQKGKVEQQSIGWDATYILSPW